MDIPVSVLDGGMGSLMVKRGYITETDYMYGSGLLHKNPAAVTESHRAFLEKGATITSTATYQASIHGYENLFQLNSEDAIQLMQGSVQVARDAIEQVKKADPSLQGVQFRVAGSCGPYGACLHDGSEYTGDYVDKISADDLKAWHKPRLEALLRGGVDMLAFETLPVVAEAKALIELLRNYPNARAWLSFSCKDERLTNHGEVLADNIKACLTLDSGKQILAVGVNCTDPKFVAGLVRSIGKIDRPFIVYPNSGEVWDYKLGWLPAPEMHSLEKFVKEWVSLGVRYIGGCCRTTPEDIEKIANEVKALGV